MPSHVDLQPCSRLEVRRTTAAVLLIGAVIAITLAAMGRVWWCEAGDLWPWSIDVWSSHNSQHLADPYTLSHIEHGIGLYLLLMVLLGRRLNLPPSEGGIEGGRQAQRLENRHPGVSLRKGEGMLICLVAIVEASWEIVENTDWMIQRYRATTMSLNYYGDSIVNSLGDYGFCMAGVLLARRIPRRTSLTLLIVLELTSVLWIRDSLLLNTIMLLYPLDAIRQWQMG